MSTLNPKTQWQPDTSERALRVLLADDHPVFREGLQKLLEAEPGFTVVGAAADGLEAVELARTLSPDVLLLDLAMPRMSGLEVLRELSSSPTAGRTVLLTAAIDKAGIVAALSGAWTRCRDNCLWTCNSPVAKSRSAHVSPRHSPIRRPM